MANRNLLQRGESSASAYDLNLNGYTNYKDKLEDDHRKMSVINKDGKSNNNNNNNNNNYDYDYNKDDDDDFFGGETVSYLQGSSHHQSQDIVWIKVFDEAGGAYYYFNTFTGESSWDKPADFIERSEVQESNQALEEFPNTLPGQSQSDSYHPEDYDLTWNDVTLDKIQHDWNPQSEDFHDPERSQPTSYSPNQKHSTNKFRQNRHHRDNDNENGNENGNDSDDQLRLSAQTNLMNQAYGTMYDSQNLIIDEKTMTHKKFLQMKKGGSLLREHLGWEEWLSPQGALFYLKKDGLSGQWDPPPVFTKLEMESNQAKNHRMNLYQKDEYAEEERKKANAYRLLLEEYEMKRHDGFMNGHDSFEQLETIVKPEIIQDIYFDRLKQSPLPRKGASKRQQDGGELSAEYVNDLEEFVRQDEYGNNTIKISHHYNKNGKLNEITTGMKEIYKALRNRDTEIDDSLDVKTLEHRSEKVKQRWQQYLEVKNERDEMIHLSSMTQHAASADDLNQASRDHLSDSDDDHQDSNVSFARLTLNAMITAQRWPWTQYVELTTDRKFYKNEIENIYQFNIPKEFHEECDQHNNHNSHQHDHNSSSSPSSSSPMRGNKTQKRRLGVVNSSQGKDKNTTRSGGSYLSTINLETSNIYLREKYNSELQQRREYLKFNLNRPNEINRIMNRRSYGTEPGEGGHGHGHGESDVEGEEEDESQIDPKKRYLKAYDAPTSAPLDSITNGAIYWKEIYDLQKKIENDVWSPWYDAHLLLQRLRRFEDMKVFVDSFKDKDTQHKRGGGGTHKGKTYSSRGGGHGDSESEYQEAEGVHNSTSFVLGGNNNFRYQERWKNTKESLENVEKTAAFRRQASHRAKQKSTQLKTSFQSFSSCMDSLLFLSHNLEETITSRHLLEACVHMKSTLLRPRYKHELNAYLGVKSHQLIPNTMSLQDLQAIPLQEVISLPYWNVHLVQKSLQYFTTKELNYSTDFVLVFSSKLTKKIQYGLPFDVKYHLLSDQLSLLRVYDQQMAPKRSLDNQKQGLNHVMEHVLDSFGGKLFYCSKRDLYSWREKILSINYYDTFKYKKIPIRVSRINYNTSAVDDKEDRLRTGSRPGSGPGGLGYGGYGEEEEDDEDDDDEQEMGMPNSGNKKDLRILKKKLKSSLSKRSYSYRPLALLEHRHENIWIDLEMTKKSKSFTSTGGSSPNQINPNRTLTTATSTTTLKQLLKVITEDEDDFKQQSYHPSSDPNDKRDKSVDFNDQLLLQSEITPLNLPLIQNHHHQNQICHLIHYQFVQMMISSHIYPPYLAPTSASLPPPSQRITPHDIPDTEPLSFELELTSSDYDTYTDLLYDLVESPLHIQNLLHLTEYFIKKKLFYESYFTLLRIIEITTHRSFNNKEEYSLLLLYSLYLSISTHSYYLNITHILKLILSLCPTSPSILSYSARIYHLIHLDTQAEELYVGAMLIDPLYSQGLHGYSLFLIEKGDYQLACRYLNRITSDYQFYSFVRLQYVWIQEILGKQSTITHETASSSAASSSTASSSSPNPYLDALLHQYQLILPHCGQSSSSSASSSSGMSSSNKLVLSLILSSIGHFYHIYQNNLTKSIEFYLRSLKVHQKNGYTYGMYACALSSELDHTTPGTHIHLINTLKQKRDSSLKNHYISRPGLETELIVNSKDEEIDANFRKSLQFIKGSNRWIILLAYGEFVINRVQDMTRGEEILWEAMRLTISTSAWCTIALVHFYQYVVDNLNEAKRLLIWSAKFRQIPDTSNKFDKIDEKDDEEYENEEQLQQDDTMTNSDNAALCIARAYIHFQNKEFPDAIKYCRQSLKFDNKYAPTWRCLALIEWCQGLRPQAIGHFNKSLKLFSMNPYCLRSAAIANALMGNYQEAVHMIQAAVEIGGSTNCLSWRAAGQITYLYDGRGDAKVRAINYLQKACDLSNQLDFEAGRLLGQIQMELGQYQEALNTLRRILPIKPCDSVALTSLGLCLSALGNKPPHTATSINYGLKIKLMDDPNEFVNSYDPEELLEAGSTFNLSNIFYQKSGGKKSSHLGKSWGIVENHGVDEIIDDPLETHDTDVPPCVLYWHGMYCLQKGGSEMIKKAKTLFDRATHRADYPPHLLALHKLGWLAETRRDLRTAERYYCFAIQMEPMDPLVFLQLSQMIQTSRQYVEQLLIEKNKQLSSNPVSDNSHPSNSSSLPNLQTEKMKKKKKKKISSTHLLDSAVDDHSLDLPMLQKRCVLHQRVEKFCQLRQLKYQNQFVNLQSPGRFVYYDIFWLEQYMSCFTDCEDWSWLMRCGQQFRNKVMK